VLAARQFWRLLILCVLLTLTLGARAEGIVVKSAELVPVDETYFLNAGFELNLGQTVEDALKKGVPLNFLVEFELTRPRYSWFTYWFSETVVSAQREYKLSYNALLRQYQISIDTPTTPAQDGVMRGIGQNFYSLSEALATLSRIRNWQIVERGQLKKRVAHEASLSMKLDVSLLPKPLQVNAIASRSWNLESERFHWTITP
jgi:hypothetical protein